jgi:hypothetical protein
MKDEELRRQVINIHLEITVCIIVDKLLFLLVVVFPRTGSFKYYQNENSSIGRWQYGWSHRKGIGIEWWI